MLILYDSMSVEPLQYANIVWPDTQSELILPPWNDQNQSLCQAFNAKSSYTF